MNAKPPPRTTAALQDARNHGIVAALAKGCQPHTPPGVSGVRLGRASGREPPVQGAVLDRLGDVGRPDRGRLPARSAIGARDLEHPREGPGREAQRSKARVEQAPGRRRRGAGLAEAPRRPGGVERGRVVGREARRLALPRRGRPAAATAPLASAASRGSSRRRSAGTSTCRSIRSSSGPEMRER